MHTVHACTYVRTRHELTTPRIVCILATLEYELVVCIILL